MTRPNVYIDLDRTLFDTAQSKIIWQYIAKYFGIDGEEPYRQGTNFHVQVDADNYYYDFGAQLKSLGFNPVEVYETLQKTDLADDRFLLPGAKELVQWLSERAQPSIITFGADDYQRFKVSLCPSLAGLFVVTTQKPKPEILQSLPHEGAWLIDDKAITGLPEGMRFIQVSLEGNPTSAGQAWPVLTSLKDVQEYLSDHM